MENYSSIIERPLAYLQTLLRRSATNLTKYEKDQPQLSLATVAFTVVGQSS
jgi:hypothetical protein